MTSTQAPFSNSPSAIAWRNWLEEYAPKLFLFARNQTRSYEDAQDVLQDAIVKLVHKIREGEFEGGQEAWQPYLYATIRRLSIDLSRKESRRKRREELVSGDDLDSDLMHSLFDKNSSNDETRGFLESAMKNLPEKFSEVIIMKIWGEQTFADISKTLDISQNTAASRYRYGLESLKRQLDAARRKGDI